MDGFKKLLYQCDKNIDFYTKHLENLRQNITLQEEAKRLLNRMPFKQDYTDFKEMALFNNYNGYITIATLDLSVNLKNLVVAKTDWEKIFFIKNSYLIIHETIIRLNPADEKKSAIQMIIESSYPDLKESFKELLNDLVTFKNALDYKKIENTRHYTAGHIEKSLKRYYDTVQKLDGEEAANFISQFLKILNKALFLTRDYAVLANKIQQDKSKDLDKNLSTLLEKIQRLINK